MIFIKKVFSVFFEIFSRKEFIPGLAFAIWFNYAAGLLPFNRPHETFQEMGIPHSISDIIVLLISFAFFALFYKAVQTQNILDRSSQK